MKQTALWLGIAGILVSIALLLHVKFTNAPVITTDIAKATETNSTVPSDTLIVINNKRLTKDKADREVELRIGSDRKRLAPDRLAMLRRDTRLSVVNAFINRQALLAEADKQNIQTNSTVVEERWQQVQSGKPSRLSSDDILRIHLIGLDRTRTDVIASARISVLLDRLTKNDVAVSKEDIQQYREDHANHLNNPDKAVVQQLFIHVLTNDVDNVRTAKRKQIDSIHAELIKGDDFGQLIKQYSNDATSSVRSSKHRIKQGEIGSPVMEDVIFSIETNTVSPVIESKFGYHIIEVISREKGRTPSDDEIKSAVGQQKRSTRLYQFIETLKNKSTINNRNNINEL